MYSTITLQLDIAAIVEAMGQAGLAETADLYQIVQQSVDHRIKVLEQSGCPSQFARQLLLEDETLYAKYLLSSGSLLSKQTSGATDINKFYGKTAPNFLKQYHRFSESLEHPKTEIQLTHKKGTECLSID